MADNVPITAGSGTSIATDDCAGVQFQRVKLVDGTLDSTAAIPGDATNGLRMSRAADTIPALFTMQSAAAANGNGTTLNALGYASVLALISGTNVLTVTFEGSLDDTTWVALQAENLDTPSVLLTAISNPLGTYRVDVTGFKSLRARVSGYVSGNVTVKALLSQSPTTHPYITNTLFTVKGEVAQDQPASFYPVLMGGRAYVAAFDVSADGDAVPLWCLRNGAVVVAPGGSFISVNNSRSTTLTSGAVFTGTFDEITDYAVATISTFSNVASATDGLSIQQSSDGANWDVADVYTVAAGAAKHVTVQCALRYLRVVYTNGGTNQTSFRLQTILHRVNQRGSSVRPQDARTNEQDMEEGLAYGMSFNGTTWDRERGVQAIAHGTNPTAVAAAARTPLYANRAGIPFVMGGHPNVVTVKHTTVTTAVTDAAVITVATGLKIVVTSFMFTLDNASTVFPTVLLGFGATNTPTTTGVIGAHGGVPAGGGFGRGDGSGILGIGADGEDLRLTTTGNATGNGLQLVVTYYTIES